MEMEFDAAKSERNLRERGLPFDLAKDFDWDTALVLADTRRDYGELRYRTLGWIEHKLYVLVFTPRPGGVRVISLRRANRREESVYAQVTQSAED